MKTYDFDQTVDRAGTYSIKWDQLPADAPAGSLPLWIADMDFPCADPILDAIRRRVDRQILGYTTHNTKDYKDAVTGWFRRRHGWEIDPDTLCYSPGVVPALSFLVDILAQPGDGVLIQRPVYHPFTATVENTGRRVVNNPLLYENGHYTIDFQGLEEKMALPSVKGMILCSPHNPVGRVWTEEELRRTVDICKTYDKWIICDEIHCDLLREGVQHHPILQVCPDYSHRIIACTAPSKTFNLAGMQLSNLVIPNPVYRELWRHETGDRFPVASTGPLSIAAMTAAYNESEDWLNQALRYLDGNFAYAREFFAERLPQATVCDGQGTYLLWVDLRAYCSDAAALRNKMVREAGLVLDEGDLFGPEGAGFERINLACPRGVLRDCLERMARVLR